ncbi:hypothetical protein GCM10025767_14760 [Thalassotalea piscium]
MTLSAFTTWQLVYLTPEGDTKFALKTEYTWQPSVDKYAVESIFAYHDLAMIKIR